MNQFLLIDHSKSTSRYCLLKNSMRMGRYSWGFSSLIGVRSIKNLFLGLLADALLIVCGWLFDSLSVTNSKLEVLRVAN